MAALYLLDSAHLGLAPDIVPWEGGLRDLIADSVYLVNHVGEGVGRRLAAGTTLQALLLAMRQEYRIDEQVARADLTAFIGELHAHRLVSIRQSYLAEAWLRFRRFLLSLLLLAWLRVWPSQQPSPNRRYPATPGWIARGCFEAHQPTLLLGAVLALVAGSLFAWRNTMLGLPALTAATLYAGMVMFGYAAGIGASGLLHELAHYWTARRCGVRVRSVFVRMGVVGISHDPADPWPTLLVSAAGPVAAVVVMGGLCLAILNVPILSLTTRLPLAFACLLIAAQHLPSLTPLTMDGRVIVQAAGKLLFSPASKG